MKPPAFSVDEWLVCPKCGITCDAPFSPPGVDQEGPSLVLGSTLPEFVPVPLAEWKIEVTACCPKCGHQLRALAGFRGHTLSEFTSLEESRSKPPENNARDVT
jgi:hypothetical protein